MWRLRAGIRIRDLLAIQQRLDRFAPGPAGWIPPVDIHETADEYVITAELPGLERDDIEIQVDDGRLTISGVRRERDAPCEQYHRVERGHGDFSRTFQLPLPVDADRITADLHDGVLTVICPKAAEAARAPHSRVLSHASDALHALSLLILACGFLAGLVLTGRMRATATEAAAPAAPAPQAAAAGPRHRRCRCPAGAARLHARRRAHRPGRRQHLVARRSSRGRTRRSPTTRSSGTSSATTSDLFGPQRDVESSLGSGVDRQRRRLHPHQQPRRRRRSGARSRCASSGDHAWRSATSARCAAQIVGVDPATDLALLKIDARRTCRRCRGAIRRG